MAATSGGMELNEKYKRLAMDYAKVRELAGFICYTVLVVQQATSRVATHACRLRGS